MEITFSYENNPNQKQRICERVLSDLPLWFGIPEANKEYCEGVRDKIFIKVSARDEDIGFASLKRNNEYVLEIYVMGIKNKYHRMGIGKRLVREIIDFSKKKGYLYLEVKTLDESRESEEYRKTRLFYKSAGFIPIDVMKNEWGKNNPCLIMLLNIERACNPG